MKFINKNWKTSLAILMVFAMVFQIVGPIASEYSFGNMLTVQGDAYEKQTVADDVYFQFITDVTITDGDGNSLGADVPKDSNVTIEYDFVIPDNYDIEEGQEYIFILPDVIDIDPEMKFSLGDKDNPMAQVVIGTNNIGTITFTEEATRISDISGSFKINTKFDEEKIGNEGETEIEFDLGEGKSKKIKVNFEKEAEDSEINLVKSGSYSAGDNEVTWVIKVKPNTTPNLRDIKDVVITDEIQKGQTYIPNSARIEPSETEGQFNFAENILTYNFGGPINKEKNEEYTITFKTKPNEEIFEGVANGKTVYFKNQAESTFENGGHSFSNEPSVEYTKIDYVTKDGEYIKDHSNRENDRIIWTITVNKNGFDIKDAKIVDTIPQWLKLDKTTIKLDPEIDGKDYVYDHGDEDYKEGSTILSYELGDISETYTLTYETIIKDPDHYKDNDVSTYNNLVNFTGTGVNGEVEKGVGVGEYKGLIEKSGNGYNAATQEITWKIIVNKNEIEITNAVVTDKIKDGQEFVPGSIKVGEAPYPDSNYNSADKTITLELNTITKQTVITFKTKVTDPNIWANNSEKTFHNTAKLTGVNIDQVSDPGEQIVESQVINKTGTGYNHETREATWKIVVNKNAMPMTNAIVKDVIELGQEFVQGSVNIDPNIVNASSFTGDTLTINLGNIEKQHIITFKTKIINPDDFFKENGNKKLTNTATLTLNELLEGSVKSIGENSISNTVVSKTGEYNQGEDFIDWEVIVNQNKLEITNATLADTLQEGLLLDTSSIKLYTLKTDADGSLIEDQEIVVTAEHFDYNSETREFEFKLGSIKNAYKLQFTTDVDDKYNQESFQNTINFKGSEIDQDGSSSNIIVKYQTGSGTITGRTGSITVIKVDENDNSSKLKGAVFELYDKFGKLIRTSDQTGENGEAIFDKLKFSNDYTVKEKVAPAGYVISDYEHTFQLKKGVGQKDIIYEFENTKIKRDVTANKIWIDGPELKPTIELQLYRNNKVLGEPITLENKKTEYTWEGLDKTDNDGVDYIYTVKEVEIPESYDGLEKGLTVTNTYVIPKTEVTATKEWVGGPEGKPMVWFKLYRQIGNNVEEVPNKEIKELASGITEVKWTGLDKTDINGNEFNFLVKEVNKNGEDFTPGNYEKIENKLEITNHYVSPTDASAKANKKWVDGPDSRGTVWFKLLRKSENIELEEVPGVEIKELKNGITEVIWTGLTKTDNKGKEYNFSVKEVNKNGEDFEPDNYGKVEDGLTVTNTYVIPKTQVTGTKKWIGGHTVKPIIELQLFRNDEVFGDPIEIKNTEEGYTWENLDATDINGKKYKYTVDEVKVPSYYSKSISEDGLTITNRYNPPTDPTEPPEPTVPVGRIKIIKRDTKSNELLAGGEFQIINSDNRIVNTLITNSQGSATSKYLPLGTYTIKEVKAPKGYKIMTEVTRTTITNGVTDEVVIYNESEKPEEPTKPVDPEEPKDLERPKDPEDPDEETDIDGNNPGGRPNVDPDDPEEPKDPSEETDLDGDTPGGKPKISGLPVTGSKDNILLYALGLLSIVIGLVLRKKIKHNS